MAASFSHSGHDFAELHKRWQALAVELGVDLREIATVGDLPVLSLSTDGTDAMYISAGVHGDECAPIWALLHWAEQQVDWLRQNPFQIFPCLNPVGIIENTRVDGEGRDLNRGFEDLSIPVIAAWQAQVGNRQYRASLNLHEDYDARGSYLYEIANATSRGRQILDACEDLIPYDRSSEIDGHEFENGLLHHPIEDLQRVVDEDLGGGYPEAIYLALKHTATALTFETPSELDLSLRIAAHQKAIETFVALS